MTPRRFKVRRDVPEQISEMDVCKHITKFHKLQMRALGNALAAAADVEDKLEIFGENRHLPCTKMSGCELVKRTRLAWMAARWTFSNVRTMCASAASCLCVSAWRAAFERTCSASNAES